jgi:hypothetical protein
MLLIKAYFQVWGRCACKLGSGHLNLGKKMVRRKAAQLVPLLGAVVGGTTSTLFIYEVGIAAQRLLQERWFGRDIETEGKP